MIPPAPIVPSSLRSLGVPAAFSTRVGGVSTGAFSSLNFGNPGELAREQRDPVANINRNFEILFASAGFGRARSQELVQVYQVHGADVLVLRPGDATHTTRSDESGRALDTKADAIVTDDPSRILCVRTADCAPVLLASADGRVVAAVHAGWRGVIAGVVPAAVRAMRSLGASDITGAIGPCISFEHFEVGPEVIAEFRKIFGAGAPCRIRGRIRDGADPTSKGYVDLQEALRRQLAGAGVALIETVARCTFAEPEVFFSHRRDKGLTGRMVAVISPRG